jgi:pimeloyl-ACP methyl ester carboxylesterase
MTTFVLVPGMWLGAWAWRDVTARLRAGGHAVYPLTLTGLADRVHLAGADLDTHIADVVNLVRAEELHDVVLVAHSYGCVPVRAAADRIPELVGRVAYVDSGPLPEGMSQADVGPPHKIEGDSIPPLDWFADDPRFAGLTEAHRTELARRATPHPLASATGKLAVTSPAQPPTDLITSLMPAADVQQMIDAGHPFFAGLDRADYRVHDLPTGHWPMLSRPADLAEVLGSLGKT